MSSLSGHSFTPDKARQGSGCESCEKFLPAARSGRQPLSVIPGLVGRESPSPESSDGLANPAAGRCVTFAQSAVPMKTNFSSFSSARFSRQLVCGCAISRTVSKRLALRRCRTDPSDCEVALGSGGVRRTSGIRKVIVLQRAILLDSRPHQPRSAENKKPRTAICRNLPCDPTAIRRRQHEPDMRGTRPVRRRSAGGRLFDGRLLFPARRREVPAAKPTADGLRASAGRSYLRHSKETAETDVGRGLQPVVFGATGRRAICG